MCAGVLCYELNKKNIKTKNIHNLFFCALVGCCMGMVSAFLGIGGGPVNIIAFSWFLSMDSKTCTLHSIYVIFLSQLASLILTLLSFSVPAVSFSLIAALSIGGITGGLAGSVISRKMKNEQVDTFFGIVLIIVMLLAAYNFYRLV